MMGPRRGRHDPGERQRDANRDHSISASALHDSSTRYFFTGGNPPGLSRVVVALPVSSTVLRLFSSQTYSASVHVRCRCSVLVETMGAARASGSVTVVSLVIVSGPVSCMRSSIFFWLL